MTSAAPNPFDGFPGIEAARAVFRRMLSDDAFGERLGYLWGRWQDEREYEDFNEYIKAMKTLVTEFNPQVTFLSATKRPFMLRMRHAECPAVDFTLKVTGRGLELRSHRAEVAHA